MTDRPHGLLSARDYLPHLRRDVAGFVDAVSSGSMDAPVAACPGWTLGDLVDHLGRVHRQVVSILTTGVNPGYRNVVGAPPGADLARWYAEGAERFLATLADTDPERPCDSHQPGNRRAGYWYRRQAHEVGVHRADADLAAGRDVSYDAALAADGIAEVLDVWLPRLAGVSGGPEPVHAPVLLVCADRAERWLVDLGDAVRPATRGPVLPADPERVAAVRVAGTASDLLLALWRRGGGHALRVEGDNRTGAAFLETRFTP